MGRFDGKVVWITGATAGIGRECALEFAREGASVAVSGRRADRLQEVVARIGDLGGRGLAVPCDVTREDEVQGAVRAVVEAFDRLDVALANAGFAVSGRIEDLGFEDWRRQFDTNVFGLAVTARHALPELRKTRGRLALVGSVAAFVAAPKVGAYNASKAAVRSIGYTLATELKGSGVTCTAIHPGFVASEIAQVDNQGVYRADWEDRRPHRLMWPTDRAARVMVRAVHARKRDFVFTGHGHVAAFLGQHFPGLAAKLVG
ncbi:SDR family NAD(P)-dependent oxidoreductase [Myxococcota bacterium]|nr:SDR family NAD(P)-dependent oxidoreductase [Myxococcota bacterium]